MVQQHDEAERRWFFGGGMHLWRVSAEDTNGAFWVMEDFVTKGKTTPLHSHPSAMEVVYVIDGELQLWIDGKESRLGAGGVAVVPAGVPHALLVTSDTCRLLAMGTSSSTEQFFKAASEPGAVSAADRGPAWGGEEPARVVDFERVKAAAIATGGMTMLGPPPFKR